MKALLLLTLVLWTGSATADDCHTAINSAIKNSVGRDLGMDTEKFYILTVLGPEKGSASSTLDVSDQSGSRTHAVYINAETHGGDLYFGKYTIEFSTNEQECTIDNLELEEFEGPIRL